MIQRAEKRFLCRLVQDGSGKRVVNQLILSDRAGYFGQLVKKAVEISLHGVADPDQRVLRLRWLRFPSGIFDQQMSAERVQRQEQGEAGEKGRET